MSIDPSKYPTPRCQPGATLVDLRHGPVVVGGFSNATIPWPVRAGRGKPSLILTAELAEMVRAEPAQDVAALLGVTRRTVDAWRRFLGIRGTHTPPAPEVAARGRLAAKSPESRAAISAAAKERQAITWTPEMDAALGTAPDQQIADRLGVDPRRVVSRRAELGIAAHRDSHRQAITWTPEMDAALGTVSDGELARRWGLKLSTVAMRRHRLKAKSS